VGTINLDRFSEMLRETTENITQIEMHIQAAKVSFAG
jgi:hypothetical protein